MLSFKVVGAQALHPLNLATPVQGLMCRLRFENLNAELPDKVVDEFVRCLAYVSGANSKSVSLFRAGRSSGNSDFLSSFFSQFIKHIQIAAGSDVSIARCHQLDDQIQWDVFNEFEFETICRRAGSLAIDVMNQLVNAKNPELSFQELLVQISEAITNLKKDYIAGYPGPAIQEFIELAGRRNIPWRRINRSLQYVQFGYGKHQQIFQRSITGTESHTSAELANSKEMTTTLLGVAGIPVARQIRVVSEPAAIKAAEVIGYPIVIKPLAGQQGYGITPNIQNVEELKRAYARVVPFHKHYIVEKHIEGDDHRLLVIDGDYVGCVRRSISVVTGDGVTTINELAHELNKEPWRNQFDGDQKYHVRKLDIVTECLGWQGYNWESVPAEGDVVKLHIVPNLSQGGACTELRDEVHPDNIKMAERAASVLNLKVAGVDYLTTDISKPYWETGGGVCEVNVSPAIDVMFPSSPPELKKLFEKAFNLSFPPKENVSLPVIVVMGEDSNISKKMVDTLSGQGLKVGYRAKTHSEIEECPLILQQKGTADIDAVLWNGMVEAAVIMEEVDRIRRYGLAYSQSTLIIVEDMPQIQGQPAPQILELLLQTNPQFLLLGGTDPLLMRWMGEKQDSRIIGVLAEEGESADDAFLKRAVSELMSFSGGIG